MFDRISAAAIAAVAGGVIVGGALAGAGQAAAEPDPLIPTPAPGAPAEPAPGQPVLVANEPVGAQPPPPAGAPPVPEVSNQQYGQGQTPGQLGYLRDVWHTFHSADPIGELTMSPEDAGVGLGAPPGAGPAPKLPPGYTSLTDPSSSTPALPVTVAAPPGTPGGGPALPPGYVALSDPNPPAWVNEPAPGAPAAPADPAAPPIVAPGAPTP
ncbi:hypothetical protein C1S82_14250 [Mycolicibacterium cosmeticum]|jgi:hypothetical protein|uniref:hypothetical protein n=1 Tax=Mycolicibacterium cosmeticum TaxID=258533 RepID=UPI0010FDC3FC|nr:hypothetical protein [Mycolicibacterium cosmeticum]TLH73166.1 hypothetical protein C1S82_14250 [Mycolicibacterium cosmeticum]